MNKTIIRVRRLLFLMPLCVPLLSSCPFNQYTNSIKEGIYDNENDWSPIPSVGDYHNHHLIITTISEEEYINAHGINVVEDRVQSRVHPYYKLNYYSVDEEGNRKDFTFVNLECDARIKHGPNNRLCYPDSNGNCFVPSEIRDISIYFSDGTVSCLFYRN